MQSSSQVTKQKESQDKLLSSMADTSLNNHKTPPSKFGGVLWLFSIQIEISQKQPQNNRHNNSGNESDEQ